METKKTCSKCMQLKPTNEFYSFARDGLSARCRTCLRKDIDSRAKSPEGKAAKRKWARNNKDKKRGYRLKELYGITQAEYATMLATQDGRCAICKNEFQAPLCVDHDHTTGEVRGLLCGNCNNLLGHAKDNVTTLKAAISYLKEHASDVRLASK